MNTYNRRSIRLPGYDYSQEGAYYITICVQDRLCLFGEIVAGEMGLNDAGKMVEHWLSEIKNKFKCWTIAEYIIMPDHIHFIVIKHAVRVDLCVDPNSQNNDLGTHAVRVDLCVDPNSQNIDLGTHAVRVDLCVDPNSQNIDLGTHTDVPLSSIVQWFKTMSTNAYIHGVKKSNWAPFQNKLWQRNYYEHIIRDGNDYDRIANYILDNPKNWNNDQNNT